MNTDPVHKLILRGRLSGAATPLLMLSFSLLAYGTPSPPEDGRPSGAVTMAFQLRTAPPAPGPQPMPTAPAEPGGPAGSPESSLPSYRQIVLAQLTRARHYPAREQENRNEGSVLLRLSIQKNGSLREVQILRPSVHPGLNAGALLSARRAAPFPPFPPDMPGSELSLDVRLVYALDSHPAGE